MTQARQARYVTSGEWFVPNVRWVLEDRSWTEQAACAGEDWWLGEARSPYSSENVASACELLKLLICSGCPVRMQCLRTSLDPPPVPSFVDTEIANGPQLRVSTARTREWGTWGGTDEWTRRQTEDLPLEERFELLEATFPERVRIRTEAWRASLTTRTQRSWRDKRVAAMLGEEIVPYRRPKLFTVGGRGGPGRGHRSKISSYAIAQGISYATAWRRLRVS